MCVNSQYFMLGEREMKTENEGIVYQPLFNELSYVFTYMYCYLTKEFLNWK